MTIYEKKFPKNPSRYILGSVLSIKTRPGHMLPTGLS